MKVVGAVRGEYRLAVLLSRSPSEVVPKRVLAMHKVKDLASQPAGLPEVLPTKQAAPLINRAPQTLRKWACLECGPLRPIRINGRLAWRVSDLEKLLLGEVV